jgi:hypothetical protein
VLEHEPWVSGINIYSPDELQIYEMAKQERLRDLHGPLLDTIAEREGLSGRRFGTSSNVTPTS